MPTPARALSPALASAACALLALALAPAPPAAAGDGPGLGNLTYAPDELFQPISLVQSGILLGHGNVAMVNGYLMVIASLDGGGFSGIGKIEFWDVSDPRSPVRVAEYDDPDTQELREAHGYSFARVGGRDVLAAQGVRGILLFDVSDPLDLRFLSFLDLPDIEQGDYTGDWWTFWQAPYLYVAGTDSGLYVVDASDPASPFLVTRVPTSEIAGLSVGQVFAVGNLLVVAKNGGPGFATLDIGDPLSPRLLHFLPGTTGYSHLFAAGRIFTSGDGSPRKLDVHEVDPDGTMRYVGSVGDGLDKGGYGTYQDGFFHGGQSSRYVKFDADALTQLGGGSSELRGRDEDFAVALGNLVFAGDDHGVGSALIVHQTAPDTTGPEVTWVHPADGATGQPLSTRVGVSMSDQIDLDSIDGASFRVRPAGGAPLAGTYSVQLGLVNFTPAAPLAPDTTYEVEVAGLVDWAGNAGGAFTSAFTTGSAVPPTCQLGALAPALVGESASLEAAVVTGSPPLSFSWSFGDGSDPTPPSSVAAAEHAFAAPGRYGVVLGVESPGGETSCSGVQIVHRPATALPPAASGPILFDGTRVWNVNPDNDTVTAIDAATLAVLFEVPVGDDPRTLALAPSGDVWVVNQDDATISVVSPGGSVEATLALPRGSAPYGIAFRPDGAAAYVTLNATGALVEIAPDGTVSAPLAVGDRPRGVAVAADSSRVYVTRFVSPPDRGVVYVVETDPFGVAGTIDLAVDPGPDTESSGRGVPNYLTALRISPDGGRMLVPSKKDNVLRGLFRDGQELTFESRVRTIVSQIDLAGGGVEDAAARIDLDDRDMAQAAIYSPLGDLFLVATQGTNRVEIFDAATRGGIGGANTGRAPQGLAWNADASRLFVHNYMSRSVTVLDTASLVAGTANGAPVVAEIATVANEALAPEVLRGKQIFYDAADPRMSRDGYLACASCHLDGGNDGRVWDFTQVGEGLRNTIDLRGRAGTGHGNVHWTANFDEIQDFENDVRGQFSGQGFLSDADFAATSDPLGAPKAGLSQDLDALAAYVSSLDEIPVSPYRQANGHLTPEGARGQMLFVGLGCPSCHAGSRFTDTERHDVGTILASSGQGIGQPLDGVGFETPTLMGLWLTAPYLHDGRAGTLAEALVGAEHGGMDALTPAARELLVAYLLQLDGSEVPPQCSDGIDNDEDGATDVADDACPFYLHDDETTPPPYCGLGSELALALPLLWRLRRRLRAR